MNYTHYTLLERNTFDETTISLYRDSWEYVVRMVAPRGTTSFRYSFLATARDHYLKLQTNLRQLEA